MVDQPSTVEPALRVSCGCDAAAVFLWPLRYDGKHTFFKVCKGDHKICRLLLGQSTPGERGLTPTSIIEDLIAIRNTERERLLEENDKAAAEQQGGARESLDIDAAAQTKRRKQDSAALPDSICIAAPDIGSVAGQQMRVMLGSVTSPLWCEAIPENIDYLRACVCEQTKAEKSSCMSDRARDRDPMFDCAAPGVTWVPSRSAFRLRYKDKDTGLMKYKDFFI